MKKITLLIADDHAVARAGLRALLDDADDLRVVGEAEDGYAAVKETRRLRPDIVIMDIAMPRLNGVEATRQITRSIRSTRVIGLSAYSDVHHVRQALEAGAAGFVTKQSAGEHLLDAIRKVHQGHPFFSPSIMTGLLSYWEESVLNAPEGSALANKLTSRQTEVLQLVAEGFSTKEIAVFLSISVRTVQSHRQGVLDALELQGTAALTRYAARNGIIHLGPLSGADRKRSGILGG